MSASINTVGNMVSSFVYLFCWDLPLAQVQPFNLLHHFSLIRLMALRALYFC